jgi:transcriptional regulator with XRE-family HTH domain
MEIFSRIKNIRESKNLSQEFVGNELGIGQSGYSKIENDKRELTVKELIKLSQIFDIDIMEIVGNNKEVINSQIASEPNAKYGKSDNYDLSINISIKDWSKSREILELIGLK